MIIIQPVNTEKAIRMIEADNKITFVVDRRARKEEIKKEIEEKFGVKVEKVNVHIFKNKKIAYIKLKKENPAIDLATKLGII